MKRAAETLDLRRDHVHADAAPRLLRDRGRSGEAGLEYELHGVLVGERLPGLEQPKGERLLTDRLQIHAGAVVAHPDHDFSTLALQSELDPAHVGLAARNALLGCLDAM